MHKSDKGLLTRASYLWLNKERQEKNLVFAPILNLFSFFFPTRYLINIGSLHKFSNAAILSLINSHLSACTSSMSWVTILYLTTKHLKITLVLQGIMAGLVGRLTVPSLLLTIETRIISTM